MNKNKALNKQKEEKLRLKPQKTSKKKRIATILDGIKKDMDGDSESDLMEAIQDEIE